MIVYVAGTLSGWLGITHRWHGSSSTSVHRTKSDALVVTLPSSCWGQDDFVDRWLPRCICKGRETLPPHWKTNEQLVATAPPWANQYSINQRYVNECVFRTLWILAVAAIRLSFGPCDRESTTAARASCMSFD